MDGMKNSVVRNLNTAILMALVVGVAFGQSTQPAGQSATKPGEVKATPVQISPKAKPLAAKSATTKSGAVKTAKPASSAGQNASPSAKPHSTAVTAANKSTTPGAKSKTASSARPASGSAAVTKPAATPLAATGKQTAVGASRKGTAVPAQKSPAGVPGKASISPTSKVAATPKPQGGVNMKPVARGSSPNSEKKRVKTENKAVVSASAATASTSEAAKPVEKAKTERSGSRRDPFVSPIQTARRGGPGGNCTTGKRCLDIDQLILKGIVKTVRGHMALVENASRRPYVLRVNDALYDGTVERITGDSVFFRQNTQDVLGHSSTREVVKKVSAPAV
jgi:hypothetical protein